MSWSPREFADDPAAAVASSAADDLSTRLQLDRLQAWRSARDSAEPAWQDAATSTDIWLHLTPAELGALSAELTAVLLRWSERAPDDDDPDRRPVFAFAHAFPSRP